jgi:Bacterial sugar transferase
MHGVEITQVVDTRRREMVRKAIEVAGELRAPKLGAFLRRLSIDELAQLIDAFRSGSKLNERVKLSTYRAENWSVSLDRERLLSRKSRYGR